MRESLNYNMIPLPHDNMNEIVTNVGPTNIITNISAHAYYGYQPQIHTQTKNFHNGTSERITKESASMDVQFDNLEENNMQIENDITRHVNRKRRWNQSDSDILIFKKRRQNNPFNAPNDESSYFPSDEQMQTSPAQKAVHLRTTHNIPDLPRCIMEFNQMGVKRKEEKGRNLLLEEDILRETHGVNMYHWYSYED